MKIMHIFTKWLTPKFEKVPHSLHVKSATIVRVEIVNIYM